MPLGSMTFVLHTHLPYCRLAGRWPHGEEWFHEAMLECYLPLLGAFRELRKSVPGPFGVTINISPILAEQMADPLMLGHFREYLADRLGRARADKQRFSNEGGHRSATAAFHEERYEAAAVLFETELAGDVIAGFRRLEEAGHIEIASSAATHGYLPLLDDDDAVRFQVRTGIQSHERLFGRKPRSFWLPECAYTPGIERILEEAGVRVFFVETHLITGGHTRGKALGGVHGPYPEMRLEVPPVADLPPGEGNTFEAYAVGESNVAVLGRNENTGKQVWSAEWGYPGDPRYREFHKKDDASGLRYWRVTGPKVDLGEKAEYDPTAAAEAVRQHAAHFPTVLKNELAVYQAMSGSPGLVMASYDTELFGHWWMEGVSWLEQTIANLAMDPDVVLIGAGDLVASRPPKRRIALPEGSWGAGGDHRTWMNAQTAWTWPEVHSRQGRAQRLFGADNEATRQLARELLLLQSSDWQFLISTEQAGEYATERFNSHCERFDRIADAIEAGDPSLAAIVAEIGALDNPFPAIQPLTFARGAVSA